MPRCYNHWWCAISTSVLTTVAAVGVYYYHQFVSNGNQCLLTPFCKKKKKAISKGAADCAIYPIDYSMHAETRMSLITSLNNTSVSIPPNSAVILDGGCELPKYDTDTVHAYRQESFFQYLFGVREPDCRAAIDLKTNEALLFIPRLSEEWELWCGPRPTLEAVREHYGVDAVYYTDETAKVLKDRGVQTLLRLQGVNSDSGMETVTKSEFVGIDKFVCNDTILHPVLTECRVFKNEKELSLMRFVNGVSSKAHIEVMKEIRVGMYEFHAESTFCHYCYSASGARLHAYTCICGSGANASTLHYGHAGAPNDKQLDDGDLFLNDMGAELHGYASDITCSFPVNGKFTADQALIYNGVLKSHDAVIDAIRDGADWNDLHLLSHSVMAEYFLQHGLFKDASVKDIMEAQLTAYFYPHGLGHLMGLDVHDVGGFPTGTERSTKRILRKIRCGRVLRDKMVVTVEPGFYFIDAQLRELKQDSQLSKLVNWKMVDRFRGSGGVRIESDIIVHSDHGENMTKVPRTIAEVEACMA